jgi:alpha-1,2-mannosyltransferase
VWAPTALCLRPIDSCFANGQVNLLVFGFVMLGVRALARRRELRGASWLGLAAALKLVPALFLAWLAARRRWRAALVGACVALGLALLAPMPMRGVQASLDDLQRWAHEVAGPFASGGEELPRAWPRTPGQSLTGAVYRLSVEDPARLADRSLPPAAPSPEALERARFAVTTASVLLLALLFVPLLRGPRAGGTRAWVHEVAFVVTTALLIAPLVRKAHLVWLLLPFAVLVQAAFDPRTSGAARRAALVVLGVAVLLVGGTSPALVGRGTATLLLVFAAPFWGLLALHAWIAGSVWRATLGRGP